MFLYGVSTDVNDNSNNNDSENSCNGNYDNGNCDTWKLLNGGNHDFTKKSFKIFCKFDKFKQNILKIYSNYKLKLMKI